MLKGSLKLDAAFNTATQKSLVSKQRVDELTECINTGLTDSSKLYNEAQAAQSIAIAAIKEIRDNKLYLAYCDSFEEFCALKIKKSFGYVYKMLRQHAVDQAMDKNSQKLSSGQEIPLILNDLQKENPETEEVTVMNEPAKPVPNRNIKEVVSVSERIEAVYTDPQLTPESKLDRLRSIDWSGFKLLP